MIDINELKSFFKKPNKVSVYSFLVISLLVCFFTWFSISKFPNNKDFNDILKNICSTFIFAFLTYLFYYFIQINYHYETSGGMKINASMNPQATYKVSAEIGISASMNPQVTYTKSIKEEIDYPSFCPTCKENTVSPNNMNCCTKCGYDAYV